LTGGTLTGGLIGTTGSFSSSGSGDTFTIGHTSGSGIALNITKNGNGEGLYINKASGSGNAATIIGTLNATTLVKSGGTSSQFLMADGSVNTSVLPSGAYLPLTGGTLTGALSGTSATFSGNGLFGGSTNAGNAGTFTLSVGVPGTTAGGLQLWAATNQSSFLQFGDGTSAADNYRGYVAYNHATDALTLGSAGADRLTIASTGAATFTTSLGISAIFNSTDANGGYLSFRRSGTNIGFLGNSAQLGAGVLNALELRADNDLILTTSSGSLRLTSGGNVGIGVTPAAWASVTAGKVIQIGNRAALFSYNNISLDISTNFYFDGANYRYLQSAAATLLRSDSSDGSFVFYSAPSGSAGGIVALTDRMRISSNGSTEIYSSGLPLYILRTSSSQGQTLFSTNHDSAGYVHAMYITADGPPNGAATGYSLGKNSGTNRSINAGGTINASGADYAEYMTKAIEDNIAKGDIVGVDENGLITNIFTNSKSFVVKSTDPSYIGGDTWFNEIRPLEDATQEEKDEFEARYQQARSKVDRIAFSGQVPCNVLNAKVGDYIIPIELDGKISGQAVSNPTFEQYQLSVGKVWKIMQDGRAWIAVKIG
jgi:hypothetical protein